MLNVSVSPFGSDAVSVIAFDVSSGVLADCAFATGGLFTTVSVNEPGAATVNAAEAALVMVGATSAENVAVTDCGASRRRFWGLVSPLRSPVNPVNWNPAAAVAAIGTVVPASNQPPAVMLPPFCGAVAVVSRYWVVYAP